MRLNIRAPRLNIRARRFDVRSKLKYIAGIIILVALGVFVWWGQQNIPVMQQYVTQYVGVFLDVVLAYGIALLVLASRGTEIRTHWRYIVGLILMTGFGTFAWWANGNISPTLGTFFGFILGYVAAVVAFFWVLGRYGGG